MGALAEILQEPGAPEAEHTPARTLDADTELAGQARTTRLDHTHDADTEDALLRSLGHDPERWRFAGAPAIYRRDDAGETRYTTYRYKLMPVSESLTGLLDTIKTRTISPRMNADTGAAFTFQASDLQLGKSDNEGTTGTVDRYVESVGVAVERLRRLRAHEPYGTVHLVFAGDCIEGNQSQSGRNMWRTELTITEQTRVFRALLYRTIDAFVEEGADTVLVDVVNGNHDEVQRYQTTRPDDGHATEAAIAVREGLALNEPAYGHVQVRVPVTDQGYMTVPVGDTVFTIAHGHQWRRNQAMNWWSGQAFYEHNPGGAHVLAHGHFHEHEVQRAGKRWRICSPTYDQGSNYFRDLTGAVSQPGGIVYTTCGGQVNDMSIV
ncbi:hypothetical protein [Tomitella gaofuii]|uniref:hypothetical protein n=1 Tax=Tomitella gaofuii TaxID=2760083 RepID=UPI0015F8BC59|nr:hypothetical protein [Tomitella gaofuii]